MKRLFRPKSLSRALAILTSLACIAVAIMPMPQTARGAGAVSLAVVTPENSAHTTPAISSQFAQALYDGVVATGRYDVKGGGPIATQIGPTGDEVPAALAAGSHAGAEQVVVTDILQVGDGKIVYRMSIYRVNPVMFGRSQVFQQHFPPTDPHVFSSQFGTDLAALEAPRTATGTIYQVTGGILADTGSAEGFHLGQRFNVVRDGKKVAEAQIAQISDAYANMDILNPSPNYQPKVGDLLISQEPGPAIPQASNNSGGNTALGIIALLAGVGAALLAIGHQGTAATVSCPGPTPTGPSCTSPTPTGGGSFTVAESSLVNTNPLQPTFQFTFTKPVLNAASFNFGDVTTLYVQSQPPPPATLGPPSPLNTLGGALGTFDATGTVMTVSVTGSLTAGFAYFINFTNLITATDGSALTFTSIRYPLSGTLSTVTHPATIRAGNTGTGANGNTGGGGSHGGSGSSGGVKPSGGGNNPHPGPVPH